ncbi:MAG TPA: response regulator [Thermoanaerobaculia bacterium]|nr:response regulator [Thermoanaerobaculia bacterium]
MTDTKRVLIVEDYDPIRTLIAIALRRRNIEVDEARNGREAIEKLRTITYDAAVLDLMMPDANGSEVLRFIEQLDAEVPCVVISAASEATINRAKESRVVHCALRKPFDIDELSQAVETCLLIP